MLQRREGRSETGCTCTPSREGHKASVPPLCDKCLQSPPHTARQAAPRRGEARRGPLRRPPFPSGKAAELQFPAGIARRGGALHRRLKFPAGSASGRSPAPSRLCGVARPPLPSPSRPAPPRRREDYISQQAARPRDPPFPGAAPRLSLGRGGGCPERAWLGGAAAAAAAARGAASGASWGRRRRRAARPGRSPGGRRHAEYVESAGAGGQGVSTAGRGRAGRGAGGGSVVAPQPGPCSPPPPSQHGRCPSPC